MTDATKDPSYPWYPRDFEADEPVKLMTLAQEGAYRRLLDHQWLNGSVPGELVDVARICKGVPLSEMRKMWPLIERCFIRMDGLPIRLQNRRLERERAKRKEHREKQTASGKAGAKARWEKETRKDGEPNAVALPNDGFALALPLATTATTTSAGRSTEDVTDGQIMAAIRDHLYRPDGKPPHGWEESREFSIMRQLRKHGKSGAQIRCVVEGLGVLAQEGSVQWLKGKTTLRAVFNSQTGCLDMWGQAEDAYYRTPPEARRKKGGATGIEQILASITPRAN